MSEVIGIPPQYVNLPSCLVYLRSLDANNGTRIKDWSAKKRTVSVGGSVVNSTAQTKYPPSSIYFPGNTTSYLYSGGSTDFRLGSTWIMHALAHRSVTGFPAFFGQASGNNWMLAGAATDTQINLGTTVGGAYQTLVYNNNSAPAAGWHRYVLGQTSNAWFLYIDGTSISLTSIASGSMGSSNLDSTPIAWGLTDNGTKVAVTQYLDEFAIWSANQGGPIPTAAQLNSLKQRMIV